MGLIDRPGKWLEIQGALCQRSIFCRPFNPLFTYVSRLTLPHLDWVSISLWQHAQWNREQSVIGIIRNRNICFDRWINPLQFFTCINGTSNTSSQYEKTSQSPVSDKTDLQWNCILLVFVSMPITSALFTNGFSLNKAELSFSEFREFEKSLKHELALI